MTDTFGLTMFGINSFHCGLWDTKQKASCSLCGCDEDKLLPVFTEQYKTLGCYVYEAQMDCVDKGAAELFH